MLVGREWWIRLTLHVLGLSKCLRIACIIEAVITINYIELVDCFGGNGHWRSAHCFPTNGILLTSGISTRVLRHDILWIASSCSFTLIRWMETFLSLCRVIHLCTVRHFWSHRCSVHWLFPLSLRWNISMCALTLRIWRDVAGGSEESGVYGSDLVSRCRKQRWSPPGDSHMFPLIPLYWIAVSLYTLVPISLLFFLHHHWFECL